MLQTLLTGGSGGTMSVVTLEEFLEVRCYATDMIQILNEEQFVSLDH